MRLRGSSSLIALFLAGLAGCGSGVTLVEGIPPDATADVGVDAAGTTEDDAAADTEDDGAAGEDGDQGGSQDGDQDGGINDNDGGGAGCGVVDADGDLPDGGC